MRPAPPGGTGVPGGSWLRWRVLGCEVPHTVNSDSELLAALGKYFRSTRPQIGKPIVVTLPVPGLENAERVARALALAEAKWFINRLARSGEGASTKWTFDMTARGAEAFDLD